jgi:hypothetical protein
MCPSGPAILAYTGYCSALTAHSPPLTTKSIDSMPGAKAFNMLVGSIHACIEAAQSSSTDPQRDAIALWAALHGYVGLLAGTPEFPWPPQDAVVDQFVNRLAYLTPQT